MIERTRRRRRRRQWHVASCILLATSILAEEAHGSVFARPTRCQVTTTRFRRWKSNGYTSSSNQLATSSAQWRQQRGGSVTSSSPNNETTPPFDEHQILDSFRSEICEIMAECNENVQNILTELEHDVRHELQLRRDQKFVHGGVEADLADALDEVPLEEILSLDEDSDEDLDGMIKLDIFSDLRKIDNSEQEDLLVGDTDEDDTAAADHLTDESPFSNHDVVDSVDYQVLPFVPMSAEEEIERLDNFHNDTDQELVEPASIPSKAKNKRKGKRKPSEKQSDAETVEGVKVSVEEQRRKGVAFIDDGATTSSENLLCRPPSTKNIKRRKRKTKTKKDDTHRGNDYRNDNLQAPALTTKAMNFRYRAEKMLRSFSNAMLFLLAVLVIFRTADIFLHRLDVP